MCCTIIYKYVHQCVLDKGLRSPGKEFCSYSLPTSTRLGEESLLREEDPVVPSVPAQRGARRRRGPTPIPPPSLKRMPSNGKEKWFEEEEEEEEWFSFLPFSAPAPQVACQVDGRPRRWKGRGRQGGIQGGAQERKPSSTYYIHWGEAIHT